MYNNTNFQVSICFLKTPPTKVNTYMYKGDPLLAGLVLSSDWFKNPVNVILIRTKMFSQEKRLGIKRGGARGGTNNVNLLDHFFQLSVPKTQHDS